MLPKGCCWVKNAQCAKGKSYWTPLWQFSGVCVERRTGMSAPPDAATFKSSFPLSDEGERPRLCCRGAPALGRG